MAKESSPGQPAVVGVFDERADAERAVQDLREAGLKDDQIGFVTRGEGQGGESGNKAGGGAATGLVTGGVLGGIAGAIAAGLIPGVGPLIAGGILAVTVGGAAAGAAAGGLVGALIGLGIPEKEARAYEDEVKAGRTLVTARPNGRAREVQSILRQNGARNIKEEGQGMEGEDYQGAERRGQREPVGAGSGTYRASEYRESQAMEVTVTPDEVIIKRSPSGRGSQESQPYQGPERRRSQGDRRRGEGYQSQDRDEDRGRDPYYSREREDASDMEPQRRRSSDMDMRDRG